MQLAVALKFIQYTMVVTCILLFLAGFQNTRSDQDSFMIERQKMVSNQLIARGISDLRVISAFEKVERHLFVPEALRRFAYADQPLPIGDGQTISQPYMVAYMSEVIAIQPGEKVLEIGTGSGYQAAILAEMGAHVYSIEVLEPLAERAANTLNRLGYKNLHLKTGDGYLGWNDHAPYDAIVVTCSPTKIPQALQDQLAEGGRMIVPVGSQNSIQYLYLLEKKEGKIKRQNKMAVRFVPMIDADGKAY